MRTTLKTTTALLACLNLAVPVPALAQSAASSALSVCASEPTSDACREARQQRKAAQQQEKAAQQQQRQQEKAARQEEKAARQEEKAAQQQEKAARQQEQARRQEEKAARQEEKAARQAQKAERQEEKAKARAEAEAAAPKPAGNGNGQGNDAPQTSAARAATGGDAIEGAGAAGGQAGATPDAADQNRNTRQQAGEGQGQRARQQAEDAGRTGGQGQKARQQAGDDAAPKGNRNAERDRAAGDGTTAAQRAARSTEPGTARNGAGANQGGGGGGQRAQALAAARGGGGKPQEVTNETVTEESARSSAEDFASGIDRSPEASNDGDDGGLSKLEKALLLGAGALAVGSLMRGGREVVASADDRVVVSGSDGGYQIIKDDNALLRQPGSEVETQTFDDGSTRTIVNRPDGSQIVTIRDPELRVVRRVRVLPDGQEILLIDDSESAQPVDVTRLNLQEAPVQTFSQAMDDAALRQALAEEQAFDRSYSLNQVRSIEQVRAQVPAIDLETITFASGSAAITPAQAEQLTGLGRYISDAIAENPREIFLVEGHTDAVGDAAYNLALSDRRAESVALALTEYFDVPPENLVVQGYGEQFLKVASEEAEQANRRATLRRITPLLQVAASQ